MIDEFPGVERDAHTRQPLGTAANLIARTNIHQTYGTPPLDLPAWALGRRQWRGDERVLDAGCGAGGYLDALRAFAPRGELVAGDASLRLLHETAAMTNGHAAALPPRLTLDEPKLPFADGTFDVVLAAHTLGYAPDVHHALDELHRVLRPDGVLLAVSHSRSHMAEFDVLLRRAYTVMGITERSAYLVRPDAAFRLENGAALLAQHFTAVARYDIPTMLIFPAVAPAIVYLNSLRPVLEVRLPQWAAWDALVETIETLLAQVIDYFGAFVVNKLSGVLVATDTGDFAAPLATRWRASLSPTATR